MVLGKKSFIRCAVVASALWATVACAEDNQAKAVISDIVNTQGQSVGTLTMMQGTEGVIINIKAEHLPPGYHGMHFHAVGDCSGDGFKSAKGHVMPSGKPHGFLNSKGPHEGNLPNLVVASDGTAEVELYSQMVSLEGGAANLLDEDGSTLIIHTNRDDYSSQPIGGAGGRVACAVIK